MEPIQTIKDGCVSTSAECVIWNGPDIPCISLCKGDSIQTTVYKLATKLCEISDGIIDLDDIDFTCIIEDDDTPTTLLTTIQLLITRYCALKSQVEDAEVTNIDLPECLQHDSITSLPPNDYAAYLADKICEILTTITTIQASITDIQTDITGLDSRVTALEDATPIDSNVYVTGSCVNGTGDTLIGTAFTTLEAAFCTLRTATGTASNVATVLSLSCASGMGALDRLSSPGNAMSTISGWKGTPVSLTDTITNTWLTICDMRTKVAALASPTTTYTCKDVFVDFIATFTTDATRASVSISLSTNSYIPPAWTQTSTNTLTITDGTISNTVTINVPNIYAGTPYSYSTLAADFDEEQPLTMTLTTHLTNGVSSCERIITKIFPPIFPAISSVALSKPGSHTLRATFSKPSGRIPIGYRLIIAVDGSSYNVYIKDIPSSASTVTYDIDTTVSTELVNATYVGCIAAIYPYGVSKQIFSSPFSYTA